MPSKQFLPLVFARNASALAALACLSFAGAHAQQAATLQSGPSDSSIFASVNTRPMDLATLAGLGYSSSSSSSIDADSAATDPGTLNLTGAGLQPPPRRRYGSPRYSDHMHNADGSNKYTFEVEGGLTLPIGNTFHYDNTSYAFGGGGGRQFSKKFAVLAKFDWDNFGLGKATLDKQLVLYNLLCPSTDANCLTPSTLDGNSHVWSFSVNPTYSFIQGDKYGAYAVVGVGFYHKVTTFLTPQEGTYCDPYYGICENYVANATYDHYTSNAPGFSGGLGLTYKFSRFADEKFFIEARYVFVDNSQRQGYTLSADGTTAIPPTNGNLNSAYPANSNRTTYVPIKVGVRF